MELNGRMLRRAREYRGITEEEFSEQTGLRPWDLHLIERNRLPWPDGLLAVAVNTLQFPETFFTQVDSARVRLGSLLWHNPKLMCSCESQYEFAAYLCDWPLDNGRLCSVKLCDDCAFEAGENLHLCRIHKVMWV